MKLLILLLSLTFVFEVLQVNSESEINGKEELVNSIRGNG